MMEETASSYVSSTFQMVEEAMEELELPEAAREFLRTPEQETKFQVPVSKDSGDLHVYHGYRVRWNTARGPAKGGIRFHPDENLDMIRMLALAMTLKTAVVDLPLGGGKGGVVCHPKEMSERELEALSREYIRRIADQLGPDRDVPAPDMYTDARTMAWMEDEYQSLNNTRRPGVVTGKPVEIGGSLGRDGATARGGLIVLREACDELGRSLDGRTLAIQGYGNVGSELHRLAEEEYDMKVVAVSDSQGGIYNENGLSYEQVRTVKDETGTVTEVSSGDTLTNEELLELDVEVLAPSAVQNVITAENADRIQAEIVAEMANNPSTPEANRILDRKGVFVLPDLLCNAGGVTVSYFEQVQNNSRYYWDREMVYDRLDEKMTGAFHTVHRYARERDVHNRLATLMLAVERIHKAMDLRGWLS